MIHFKLDTHTQPSRAGVEVVEIWDDDRLLGCLYPGGKGDPSARCVRLISHQIEEWYSDGIDVVVIFR